MKLTQKQAETLFQESVLEDGEIHLEVYEEGDFVSGGKYESADYIVKCHKTGRFYKFDVARTGSPYTDWYYEYDTDLDEVRQEEVKILKWVKV